MKKNARGKKLLFYSLNIVAPLALGYSIYLFFREETMITFHLQQLLSLPLTIYPKSFLSFVFLYYLPDILWAYSLTVSVSFVLGFDLEMRFRIVGISLIVEFAIEVLQKFEIISGTFDFWDLVAELVATLVAIRTVQQIEMIKEKK